jgi:rhamnose transport system ATP-binding protein
MREGATISPLVSVRGVSKRFGELQALKDVSFDLVPGEIHGLLGANGAGKSTLIGVLSGAIAPEAGSLQVAGREVALGSLTAARAAGVTVVHQETMLFPDRTVEENVFAGCLPAAPFAVVDRGDRRKRAEATLARMGAKLDLDRRVDELSLSQRQSVEIARALCAGGQVLVLDEPTSALSRGEAEGLFAAIRAIVAHGAAVVFVSHRLDEAFALTDRISVLRDGRVQGRWRTAEVEISTVTRAMAGEFAGGPGRAAKPRLADAAGITLQSVGPDRARLDFAARAGEVVGLAGLEGSGVAALLECLGGIRVFPGELAVAGQTVKFRHPAQAIARGVVFMPPDRKNGGLWLDRTSAFNIGAAAVFRLRPFALLRTRATEAAAEARMRETGVRADALRELVGRLSGGNQQRVLLGRALDFRPRVLLMSDFTRGVDVKAKADIHALVQRLADEGMSVVLTSSDLAELLTVADRIVCMRRGRIVADLPSSTLDEVRLLGLVSVETGPASTAA